MKHKTLLRRILTLASLVFIVVLLLGAGSLPTRDAAQRAHAFTRGLEFDYLDWTLNALKQKLVETAVGADKYLTPERDKQIVLDYLELVNELQVSESKLASLYADPKVEDPYQASTDLRKKIEELRKQKALSASLAEPILQSQLTTVLRDLGLTLGGQPVPPVLFHATPLPRALIISPRNVIEQVADISLAPEITLEESIALEDKVDSALDVSSLVVGIGGIGLYPTMIQETSNLNWLGEVIAHEWTHNFLTLRPLGINYLSSQMLRTMNETTASIAGTEIGEALIERFYPELAPPPPAPGTPNDQAQESTAPPAFDFYAEMHTTRVTADKLLAEGKIEEAEAYMEERRVMFWEHGYRIRKLNQAYFAFYGAYADHPSGGAAGEDPVGAAVRTLRGQSTSLAEFLNRISWMSSFEQLQQAVNQK